MFFGFTQLVWLEFVKNSKFMLVWMLTVLFAWVGPLYPLEFFYVETELYTDKEDWLYISVYIYIQGKMVSPHYNQFTEKLVERVRKILYPRYTSVCVEIVSLQTICQTKSMAAGGMFF